MFTESHTSLAVISLDSLHCCLDSEHRDHFWIGWRQTWHQEVPEFRSLKETSMPHASSVIIVATQCRWPGSISRTQRFGVQAVFSNGHRSVRCYWHDWHCFGWHRTCSANEPQSLPADVIATLNKTLKETLQSFTLNTTGILTSELNKSLAIPQVFGRVMIGVACFSLMMAMGWKQALHEWHGYSISNSSCTQRSRGDLRQFLFLDHPWEWLFL